MNLEGLWADKDTAKIAVAKNDKEQEEVMDYWYRENPCPVAYQETVFDELTKR